MSTRQDWCRCTLWRSSSSRCCLPDAVVHQDFRTGTLAAHLCAHLCAGASCTSNGEEGCCDRGRARANCAVDAAGLHRAVPWLPLSLFSLRSVSRSVGTALCARWRKCGDGESAHVAARACRRARSRWNGLDGGPPPASSRLPTPPVLLPAPPGWPSTTAPGCRLPAHDVPGPFEETGGI